MHLRVSSKIIRGRSQTLKSIWSLFKHEDNRPTGHRSFAELALSGVDGAQEMNFCEALPSLLSYAAKIAVKGPQLGPKGG